MLKLGTGRKIEESSTQTFEYDPKKTSDQILHDALINLHMEDSLSKYNILLYRKPSGDIIICNPDDALGSFAQENGTIFPAISIKEVKIQTKKGSNIVTLDLTKTVYDTLFVIADQLRIFCQEDQYSLWYFNEEQQKVPLRSSLPIVVQTSMYNKLFFKRRYFLLFSYYFSDFDSCLHNFNDCLSNYKHSTIFNLDDKLAAEIARLILYGNSKSIQEVDDNNVFENPEVALVKKCIMQLLQILHTIVPKLMFI